MQTIQSLPASFCQQLTGIFFDIDDTFTTCGQILPEAYSALWRAKEAGLHLVPVTGRPAGWVDHIARMWPVDAVIGENGGFFFWMADGKIHRYFLQSEQERKDNRQRLLAIAEKIFQAVPAAKVAADQRYREIDLAIDFCEDIPALSRQEVLKIAEIFRQQGAQAKISSIHVNGWFGNFDKMSTCALLMEKLWQQKPATALENYVYCGDSPNDEPLFAGFPVSIAVANIKEWLSLLTHQPSYCTSEYGGKGFSEMVDLILSHRKQQ